ncbi:hypothetical protein MGU_11518 [Metarhizium guizhouense ARSEF 977]|uniref:Uncharacterized protein n=1 Tax=Metarhizium guizhouense (strain ARSEF 977) TaxID=1276136 RepID=A0A0B4G3H0_METGA|nr:hypothetical protein MGU_11518 [Metarhizium guizhouense ARSEF 977]
MATATSSPPCEPDPFDLGIHTPKNLARGARAALLRDSSPVETTDIGVSPARGRTGQTPSSPLTRMCNAAIAEGQQLDEFPALPTTVTHEQRSPIDITDAANQLVDEQVAAYNAKLRVFRTFCAHFRVFVRLEADAPARNHIGYAIRAHVASKTGLELNRIPQVLQVNTGWAIRAADKLTRDLLVERQAEWADNLGATAVETSQKW